VVRAKADTTRSREESKAARGLGETGKREWDSMEGNDEW